MISVYLSHYPNTCPLAALGYDAVVERAFDASPWHDQSVGRVIAEHKERYVVATEAGERNAEITGHLRFSANGRADFPAVGDWVALTVCDAELAIIHGILPRRSMITRQAVGQRGEVQVIAANVDVAFLLQAVDRDLSINRLERYLSLCYEAAVRPIIALTKTDLVEPAQTREIIAAIEARVAGVPIVALSNLRGDGLADLSARISAGKTYCLLGSSGVGKSTLLNRLSGRDIMKTGAIGETTQRGRHVTSHRELVVLPNGGILIDNPGLREVGLSDASVGVATTFDAIVALAASCRYPDCQHTHEAGCAVLAAIENGDLEPALLESYQRQRRETAHFEASVAERHKKDRAFGKHLKHYLKHYGR